MTSAQNYTFDSFLLEPNNEFAYKTALDFSKNITSNPKLYIYGTEGLGKTHLLHAIKNYYETEYSKKVLLVNAEDFINDFLDSLTSKESRKFQEIYRNVDLLLIDDIHFFQHKTACQEELTNIFKAFEKSEKRIVCASSKTISELQFFSPILISQLESCLKLELTMPSTKSKRIILENYISENEIQFNPEIIEFFVNDEKANIRDLKYAVNKIITYMNLVTKDITLEIVKNLLKDESCFNK